MYTIATRNPIPKAVLAAWAQKTPIYKGKARANSLTPSDASDSLYNAGDPASSGFESRQAESDPELEAEAVQDQPSVLRRSKRQCTTLGSKWCPFIPITHTYLPCDNL